MKILKKVSSLWCLCAVAGIVSWTDASAAERENAKSPLKARTERQIEAFFARRLAGADGRFEGGKTFRLDRIADYRQAVWQIWQEANRAFEEEKLPVPDSLTQASAGQWHLPDSLEPHAVMPYYWGTKQAFRTAEDHPLPLFVYLHGSGGKQQEWAVGLQLCRLFADAPSLYFIPQIPNEGDYYRWWQRAKQWAWEKLLRQALAAGWADPDRLYVFGISEGGYGSQRLASFYADYWAAAGPMAGGEPLKNAPAENCAHVAFSLRTGAVDYGFYRNLLTKYTAEAFDSLQAAHPDAFRHRVELVPGRGHAIDYRPTTPWMKQYKRNPYPKFFCWENFEMDGRYRDAFYNLQVDERSNTDMQRRTYYEMRIEGNRIDLRVDEVAYETVQKDPQWGIELKFAKHYRPATRGKFTLYLCNELVDLSREVTLTVNGRQVFCGKLKPDLRHMVNSCATFFDPRRVYPAAIQVDLSRLP